MPTIGNRCHELRVVDAKATWRIVYYLGEEAVVVLEVFEKTTGTTPKHLIDTAKKRLKRYRAVAE
jgi:phage-related protein